MMYAALICSISVLVQILSFFQADAWIIVFEYPPQKVSCHSKHFQRKVCIPDFPSPKAYICKVNISRQKSKTLCIENVNYWVYPNKIIVDDGCRAHFNVTMCEGKRFDPLSTCHCEGEPHCRSFDGKWNDYNGDCEYTMVRNKCKGTVATVAKPDFEIIAKFEDRGMVLVKGTWVVKIYIRYKGSVYSISSTGVVLRNGVPINLPYWNPADDILIYKWGSYIVFVTIDVQWVVRLNSRYWLDIYFPLQYFGELCGMCGNYNGNPFDDWQLGPQCKLPTDPFEGPITANENEFGVSWTDEVYAKKNPHCVNCDPKILLAAPPPLCPDPIVLEDAGNTCEKMTEVTDLQACWTVLDDDARARFYRSCIFDYCRVGNDSTCETFLNLVELCEELGFSANDFGYFDYCKPECGRNEEYLACGDGSPTCLEYLTTDLPDEGNPCVPGCFCLDGYYENRNGVCVLPEDCGCAYENIVLEEGEIHFDNVECILTECSANHNSTEIGSIDCPVGEQCTWDGINLPGLSCV